MLNKKAFTLAELMLVFTAIGILTAILMPLLFHATPNKAELKAKKAYHTFAKAIESLVNEEPYSLHGGSFDVALFPEFGQITPICSNDGHAVAFNLTDDQIHDAGAMFCNNMVDTLNVKYSDCLGRITAHNFLNEDGNLDFAPAGRRGFAIARFNESQLLLIRGTDENGNPVDTKNNPRSLTNPQYVFESLQGEPFDPNNENAFNPYIYGTDEDFTIDGVCDDYFMNATQNGAGGELIAVNGQNGQAGNNQDYRSYYSFITSDNTGWVVQNFLFTPYASTCNGAGLPNYNGTVNIAGKNVATYYALVCVNTGDLRNIDVETLPADNQLHASTVYGMAVNRDGKIILGGRLQKLLDDDSDSNNNN